MIRKTALLILIFILMAFPTSRSWGILRVRASEEPIRVGIFDFEPLCYIENPEKKNGIFIDLLQYIALKEKWDLRYVPGSLQQCLERLKWGEIDLVVAASYDREKETEFYFTRETVISTWAQVYSNERSDIKSLLDLHDRSVGVVRDDPYNQELRAAINRFNIECSFAEFNHSKEILSAIEKRWIDAGVVDRIYAYLHGNEFNVEKTPIIFSPVELRFAVSKDRHMNIVSAIDYHLDEMKNDPHSIYYKLINETFGAQNGSAISLWLIWSMIIAAILSLYLGSMSIILRKQVRKKTKELSLRNEQLKQEIEERKKTEDERRRLETKLLHAKKMEAIGTLAGGVAHDLNNILSGIVSYPELLLLQLPKESPIRKPVLTIQESGQKAAAVVQDLLTLARRGVRVTGIVNLNDIVRAYVTSPEYEKLKSFHPDVQLVLKLESSILNILGSPVHLSKTVMNLVSNAIEAMPDGGKIQITTENCYIDRPLQGYDDVQEGDYILLKVIDQGVGIPQENLERIFEPFYTKKVMGRSGTGLGMAVVWGTVKDHKGYINVQSREGKGTTFSLYFPVTRKKIYACKTSFSLENYRGRGESVLVIDDVKEQREIASQMLHELSYTVNAASSGEEAVEYLKNHSTDLLVLDMIMDPGIDGLETYKRILKIHPKQKAVIASGFSETDRVKEVQKLGAGAYIKKPFLLDKFAMAVRNELDRPSDGRDN